MTWTYSGDPAASDLDAVRWLVGDTNSSDQLVQDEEIAYALANYGGPVHAAAVVCEQISGQFSREAVSKKVGSLSINFGAKAKEYANRCKQLRRLIATDLTEIFAGGLSISEKETLASDTDAVQPSFAKGQDDHPGVSDLAVLPKRDVFFQP